MKQKLPLLVASTGIFLFLFFPTVLLAAEFQPIVPLPNVEYATISFPEYVNRLFEIFISIGGILAVLMIAYGGIEYMMGTKSSEKKAGLDRVQGALVGLLLLLAVALLLNIINPCILEINIFRDAPGRASECSPSPGFSTNADDQNNGGNGGATQEGGRELSGSPCIRDESFACSGGGSAVAICLSGERYTERQANAQCPSGSGDEKFMCASCPNQSLAGGIDLTDTEYLEENNLVVRACTNATEGTPEFYCCQNQRQSCSPTTRATCPNDEERVTTCKIPDTEIDS